MKRRKIALLSMTALLLLSGCSQADDTSSKSEKPDFNNNVAVNYINENGEKVVDTIEGNFVNFTVANETDALNAIASVSELLGINDVQNEIEFTDTLRTAYGVSYSFRQLYKGIPIANRRTVLTVDPESNEVLELLNGFYHIDGISTKPAVKADKAKEIAEKAHNCTLDSEPELQISFRNNEEPNLVWIIEGNYKETGEVIVDAETGNILYSEPAYIDD